MPPDATADWAKRGAAVLLAAFENYRERFAGITARARRHFELRDWSAVPRDSMRRLDVYGECVGEGLSQLRARLGALAGDRATWGAMRDAFAARLGGAGDPEPGGALYNSPGPRPFHPPGGEPAVGCGGIPL